MSGDFDLTIDELRVVARYVVRHAEDVLPVFEQSVPDDPRPRAAIDAAWAFINGADYGNQASIFTASGTAARRFRYEAQAGNIGINIGVAAPMAFFPFSGWKESFFGDLHGQGLDAVEFFTQKKVVIERWPKDWTRKF